MCKYTKKQQRNTIQQYFKHTQDNNLCYYVNDVNSFNKMLCKLSSRLLIGGYIKSYINIGGYREFDKNKYIEPLFKLFYIRHITQITDKHTTDIIHNFVNFCYKYNDNQKYFQIIDIITPLSYVENIKHMLKVYDEYISNHDCYVIDMVIPIKITDIIPTKAPTKELTLEEGCDIVRRIKQRLLTNI